MEGYIDILNDYNKLDAGVFSGNTEGFIDISNDYNKLAVFVVSVFAEIPL